MDKYRVGFSKAFLKPDGVPAYPDVDLTPLLSDNRVEVAFLQNETEIRPTDIETLDALVLLGESFTGRSLNPSGRLALIARFGVGYDKVDIAACTRNGVGVSITPDAVRRPVAVAVLTLMLALTGRLLIKDRLVREGPAGFNRRSAYMGYGLEGRVLGTVGLGNIGAEVFRLARPLGMRFMAYDPFARPEIASEFGVQMVDLENLFRQADVLSVNCPLTPETRGLVSRERLSLMKPAAWLINTSRGPVVDQDALVEALTAGRLAGAGIDVFMKEPPEADDPLLKLDNVILSPHALSWTDQCFAGIGSSAINSTLSVMHGRSPSVLVDPKVVEHPDWVRRLRAYRQRFGA